MIVLLKEEHATKKRYSDFSKIVISDELSARDILRGTSVDMKSLLPPPYVIGRYINNKDFNEFYDDYKSYLKNPEIFPTITMLAYSINKGKDIAFVCSEVEYEIGYFKAMAKFLSKRYGIKCLNNDEFKALDKADFNKYNYLSDDGIEQLKKDINKNREAFAAFRKRTAQDDLISIVKHLDYD